MAKWPMGRVHTGTLGMTIDLKDTHVFPYAREKRNIFKIGIKNFIVKVSYHIRYLND